MQLKQTIGPRTEIGRLERAQCGECKGVQKGEGMVRTPKEQDMSWGSFRLLDASEKTRQGEGRRKKERKRGRLT